MEKLTLGLNEIFIYRITHIENIPYILKHGITHKNHWNANPDYRSIGDESLIINRSIKEIKVDNGVYNTKVELKTIRPGDYIPFYFGVRMPMLYVIQNGGNFVQKPTSAENIKYLACRAEQVIHHCNEFYFSDGHATDKMTTFYDKNHIQQLPGILDWQAIKSKYWGGVRI